MATQPVAPASRAGKYVTFQISRHYFAIEARLVRQVTPAQSLEPGEHPVPLFRGTVVARGRRVPVLDVRERLGLQDRASHPRRSVLLIDTEGICGLPLIGIIADRMSDVVDFRDRDFRENTVQLRPFGRPYGRPKTLFDITHVVSDEELTSLKSVF